MTVSALIVRKDRHENWKAAFVAACLLHLSVISLLLFMPDIFTPVHKSVSVIDVRLITPVTKPKASVAPVAKGPVKKALSKPAGSADMKKRVKAVKVPARPVKKKQVKTVKPSRQDKPKQKKMVKPSVTPKRVRKKPAPPGHTDVDKDTLLSRRIAAMEHKVEADKRKQSILDARLAAIAGRVGDKGGRPASSNNVVAESGGLDAAALYGRVLKNRIRSRWFYPSALFKTSGLKVTVSLAVASDGKLLYVRFEKRSGNALFDASVERAVMAAAPFPPLPADLRPGPWEAGFNFDIEEM
jgi:TonB family protein